MKRDWPLRQLLAVVRGIAVMAAVLCALIVLQLLPSLASGGLSGVRDHIYQVAIAGVPSERWDIAVSHMYEALATIVILACILFLAHRYLGRVVHSRRQRAHETR
jgi:hypothetical protein